jgi:hypothetical protein
MAYRGGNLYLIVYHSRTLTLRILIRPFSSLASTQLQHIKHHRNRHMITPPSPPHSRISPHLPVPSSHAQDSYSQSLNQLGKNSSPTPLHHDTYTRLGPGKKKKLKAIHTPHSPIQKHCIKIRLIQHVPAFHPDYRISIDFTEGNIHIPH